MATGSGNKISRKPHIFRFDGFTRTGEAGKLQVQTRNTELSGGGAYPAYALADIVLKGENVVFPAGGMNRAMSNCTPFMKKQNIYWLCLSVEKNDPFAFIMKKCKNDGFSK